MKGNTLEPSSEESIVSEIEGMTNQELFQLVHDHQKFVETVHCLRTEAEARINNNNSKEALVYLSEAERILEYAASCGKNIDRSLIISILHNEACAYQRIWHLSKCSNYLEALIYNITQYLQLSSPKADRTTAHTIPLCSKFYLEKSTRLIKYHLQYAAVSSQVKNHEGAFESSKKGINFSRQLFRALNNSFSLEREFESSTPKESRQHFELKTKVIESITNMSEEICVEKLDSYVLCARYLYQAWCKNKTLHQHDAIQIELKDFIIGNVMQIVCSDTEKQTTEEENIYFIATDSMFSQKKLEVLKCESYLKIIQKIIHLSIAYFTAGTQLRLLTYEKLKSSSPEEKRVNFQLKQSEIYHLFSLMIVFAYIPFEMEFVKHVIKSYHNSFKSDIFKPENQEHDSKQLISTLKDIDPLFIHRYQEKTSEVKVVSRITSEINDTTTPRSYSIQKSPFRLAKLQRRCQHIINKKYIDVPRDEAEKCETNKSLTYLNKKQGIKLSKSCCRSKKSLSVTNTVSKRDKNNMMVNLQDYCSPTRERKKEKNTIYKSKGYYDIALTENKEKGFKKMEEMKSPGKSRVGCQASGYKKSFKQKANEKKSTERGACSKAQKERSKSKTKSIKGVKTIGFKSAGLKAGKEKIEKTPMRVHRKESEQNEYYL